MSRQFDEDEYLPSRKKKDRAAYQARGLTKIVKAENQSTPTVTGEPCLGIVAAVYKNTIDVLMDHQSMVIGRPFKLSAQRQQDIVVGDRVILECIDQRFVIVGQQPRRSFIARAKSDRTRQMTSEWQLLAANVDIGVITVALQQPEFHPRLIDRYLVLLQDGNVDPLICLTKCDLSMERPKELEIYRQLGIPVIETSIVSGQGREELQRFLRDKTAVFVGQSGVGKSSLVQGLHPTSTIITQTVHQGSGQGRHTTTTSHVYAWADQSYVIDTPGIRSLGLEKIAKADMRCLFPEFLEFVGRCRFDDCSHLAEPGCAIRQSLNQHEGKISQQRYASYVRMMQS